MQPTATPARGCGTATRRRWRTALTVLALAAMLTGVVQGHAAATRSEPGNPPAAAEATTGLHVLAVDHGEPTRVLVAVPEQLATRTLTADDIAVQIDGGDRGADVQRLSGDDLEVAVVVDTTMDAEAVRMLQSAVVELALELPRGATMRVVDAEAEPSAAVGVPGPAIAAVRNLRPGTSDDLGGAVDRALAVLDESPRARTALLVVGRDLSSRLQQVDDRPLRSLSYLVDIGGGGRADLLGPRASGAVIAVDGPDGVREATDRAVTDLRALYLVQVPVGDPGAQTITLSLNTSDGATPAVTYALSPDGLRPEPASPAGSGGAGGEQPGTGGDGSGATGGAGAAEGVTTGQWVVIGGALVVAVALILLALVRSRRRPGRTLDPLVTDPLPATEEPQPVEPLMPRQRKPGEKAPRPQRPIVKLGAATRAALSQAHLGLRKLALASREIGDKVPHDMFRFAEARASAALSGHDRPLDAVLTSLLAGGGDASDDKVGDDMVRRAASALETGWQHTARSGSAPPAVVEINALLRGGIRPENQRRPLTPVRALNPLVEIGLEHMVLAGQDDEHAGLVARAVTAVDLMRASRLAYPVLTISPYLLTSAERYAAACGADPTDPVARDDWLQLLCTGLAHEAQRSVERLRQLRRLRGRYRDAAPDPVCARMVDVLLARPVLDAAFLARRLALPDERAAAALQAAHEAGWLVAHDDRDDVWLATGVLDVFAPTSVRSRV